MQNVLVFFLGNTMDSEVAPKGCIDKNSASNGRQYSSTCPVSRVSRRCFLFKSKFWLVSPPPAVVSGWDRTGAVFVWLKGSFC